jgi:hypothetical protein
MTQPRLAARRSGDAAGVGEYHLRMIAVAEDLAERHRDQLGRLIDSGRRESWAGP